MYRNHAAVQTYLETGGTLVVPTRQRAAAVRLAFTAAKLAQGRSAWESPDVIHWSAWQTRRVAGQRVPGGRVVRLLSATEEWFLWREALRHADIGTGLLQPDRLIDDLRRADELIDAWALQPRAGDGAETALLLQLRQRLARRKALLMAGDRLAWRQALPTDTAAWAPPPVRCLGLDELGRADRQALQQLGMTCAEPVADAVVAHVEVAATADGELELIGDWCRRRLLDDPLCRLLVVVPRLAQCEAGMRRTLTACLEGDAILAGRTSAALYALEGGVPLSSFPLVGAALRLLQAVSGTMDFDTISTLLRSGYLDTGPLEARMRLELWLREEQVIALDADLLPAIRSVAAASLGEDAAGILGRIGELQQEATGLQTPAGWAQRWVQWLKAAGWPGAATLGSREQQVRERLEALLGEYAQLDDLSGPIDCSESLSCFNAWLNRASLEPSSGDVPVTVTSDTSDPLIRYDGIWVCGLTAQDWPPATAANPYLSQQRMLAAGIDAGTASGSLRRAEQAMRAWERSADELVYSWPRQVGDALLIPSPLLPAPHDQFDGRIVAPAAPSPWFAAPATLESYGLAPAHAWPAGQPARGGAGLLTAQANCPFLGFASGRLQSAALDPPAAGLDARSHGILLHHALQIVWTELQDSAGLQRRQASVPALVQSAVQQSVAELRARRITRLPERLWEIESRRCCELIGQLLGQEALREPFSVAQLEQELHYSRHGLELRFKLDRLDRLEDGSYALMDYKSGRPHTFKPVTERLLQPQLPAYAATLEESLSAVASIHLHVDGVVWRGSSDTAGRLPQIKPLAATGADWQGLLDRWRTQIAQLAGEFAAGDARVEPAPTACQHCHARGLCRIGETDLAHNLVAADAEPESDDAAGGAT